MNGTVRGAAVAAIVVWVTYGTIGFGQVSKPSHPVPKVVALPPNGTGYVPILGGPPESVTMESGYVVLLPSASGEKHSSKQYEEVLVVLAGVGEMRITGGAVLGLKPYSAVYCPPQTEHLVANTGKEPLRYVYVAARAR